MFIRNTLALLASLSLAVLTTAAPAPLALNVTLNNQLVLATTEVDRIALIPDPSNFVFDFTHADVKQEAGGRIVASNTKNFPALIGHGIAMAVGFIEPCGINLPHLHNRATEILFVVSGEFETGFFIENGGKVIVNTVSPGQATIFPEGSIHFQQNLKCEPAVFVAALNSEDPGTSTIATNFFGLPTDIVGASLGGLGEEKVEALKKMLPVGNPALGIEECQKRCGLHSH